MQRLVVLALVIVAGGACEGPVLVLPARGQGPAGLGAAIGVEGAPPARVFVIERPEQLLRGAEAAGRLGDFELDNGRVAFVIERAGDGFGFAASGGNLVDAAPSGGEDALEELVGCLADAFPRQPIYSRVEPARRGAAAVVRAIGTDSADSDLEIETDYALAPGAIALEITTRVRNTGSRWVQGYAVGDAIEWGHAERFVPGQAGDPSRLGDEAGWIGALAARATYAWVATGALDGKQGPTWSDLDGRTLDGKQGPTWSDLDAGTLDLAPGASASVTRWLVVGDASGSEVTRTVGALRGERWARLTGQVREDATGHPLAGARVVLADRSGAPLAQVRSTDGGYTVWAPPGEYRLQADGLGRRGNELDVELRPGGAVFDVLMSRPGALAYQVTEDGRPSPARLTFLTDGGAPVRLGPRFADPGGDVARTVSGAGRLDVPPGLYRVVASRGPEDTADVETVEVPAGGLAHAKFQLARAVDAKGLLCAELHAHAAPSPDSAVSLRDRLVSALAEGLDALVATDHDVIADWQAALSGLKPARPLAIVVGAEMSLPGLGHFSAWPLPYQRGAPHGGAPDLARLSAARAFAALRAVATGERVIVADHPRLPEVGFFEALHFDPSGPLPAGWAGGFDAIEVMDGNDPAAAEAPLRDWFSLLDRGMGYTAVGGSDAHLLAGEEIGYPRTCVPLDPALGPERSLIQAIRKKRAALVTNGPFISVSVGGRGMGELAPAPKGRARLDVEVQAAPWVDARRLEVFVDGERRGKAIEIPPPAKRGEPLRWQRSIDLQVSADAWVVVTVRGDASLEPVVTARPGAPPPVPFALTNPIYLDRDLDGKYTPPRPSPNAGP